MQRILFACLALLIAVGCGSRQLDDANIVGPDVSAQGTRLTGFGSSVISCSDARLTWVTTNFSTSAGSATVAWLPAPGVQTYEVQVSYSRDGLVPPVVLTTFRTNRSEATIRDTEHGGRYYVIVRITHNDCGDVDGPWSSVLTVYFDISSPSVNAPEPPDDDDGDDDCEQEGPYLFLWNWNNWNNNNGGNEDPQPCHGNDDEHGHGD